MAPSGATWRPSSPGAPVCYHAGMKTPVIRLCLRFYPERHTEHREIAEFFRAIRASGRQGDVGRHVEAALLAYLRGQPAPRRASIGTVEPKGSSAPEPGVGRDEAPHQTEAVDGAPSPQRGRPAGPGSAEGEDGRSGRNSRMAALVRNIHRDLGNMQN